MQFSLFHLLLLIFIAIMTIWFFVNTIITNKWRNRAFGESENWKVGVFYYNPADKKIFLPKRTGLGFTLNFAQPLSIVITLLIIVIIIVLVKFV
jgi:hypothetical protein